MEYATAKQIVIPKGSRAHVLPAGSKWDCLQPFASVLVATSKDTTAELKMHLQDALDLGLVRPE
jgi:hypothetical protein